MTDSETIAGTRGYRASADQFIALSQSLEFKVVHAVCLPYLPDPPARCLDAGSGAGQNAAALTDMGYTVDAVEPLDTFRQAARQRYPHGAIRWLDDSLPLLPGLNGEQYHFILVAAVMHHLDAGDKHRALARLAAWLSSGGRCAFSLRNGPAGLGSQVYPTSADRLIADATPLGLRCLDRRDNVPSILPGKNGVRWSHLVLHKD